jgi:hypothetical protein
LVESLPDIPSSMNSLVFAETELTSPVRNLLAALDADFMVSPLEVIQTAKRTVGSALILSEAQFVQLCEAARSRNGRFSESVSEFGDVLVYPFSGTPEGLRALSHVTGGSVSAARMAGGSSDYVVDGTREMVGAFAGLRVDSVKSIEDIALRVEGASCAVDFVVKADGGGLFTRFKLPGVNLFVTSSRAVFDVSAEHQRNLDARECFSGLVPLLFFLRHCRIGLPVSPLRWANWIIDDPNLRPRYGFLDIKGLARCVRETRMAASIAFIPWNHKRTAKEIVSLFKQDWPKLSICVHGCDHTGSEFSTKTMSAALPLIDLAFRRMAELKAETSLGFERVMVFPQGRFSREAMRGLRASEMLAAVNTELVDCETGSGVRGRELLKPAIMSFGGFPLFMRRPAEEPSGNFALDLLLGKPCLVVTHHQYFEHGLKALQSDVDRLNSLEPELTWTNLERGVLSTYSVCSDPGRRCNVRLYSARTTVQPQTEETVLFTKPETDPENVEVFVNGTRLSCTAADGGLLFTVNGADKVPMTVEARASMNGSRPKPTQSRKYRLKVTARRYLTEARDNYLYRFPKLAARAASVQQLLHRSR